MARVSVIIATYNRAHVVSEAIDSVLAQTYRDFEIIVVDDASTDNTAEVLARYGDQIRYIRRQTNGGCAATRNDGIRASTGEFIAFLDSDDLYEPNRLESAISFLDKRGEYGAVYAEMLRVNPDAYPASQHWVAARGGGCSGWVFDALLEHAQIMTPAITIRREVLARVGLFDETLRSGFDSDLWWRIARTTQIGYVDEIVCTYRVTPRSLCQSGSRTSGSWVRLCRKALDTYEGLTAHQRRLITQRLSAELRLYACHLAREGRHREARAACLEAVQVALAAGLWVSALKGMAGFVLGRPAGETVRNLKAQLQRVREVLR